MAVYIYSMKLQQQVDGCILLMQKGGNKILWLQKYGKEPLREQERKPTAVSSWATFPDPAAENRLCVSC